jgi:serine/threonine protein kinase
VGADPNTWQAAAAICNSRRLSLLSEVGEGAFKYTFHCQASDGQSFALKLYRHGAADARTQREVQAITKCCHPGVARFVLIDVYAYGSERYVYSLEEFLSGGTLSQLIGRQLLPVERLRQLALSLVDSIAHIAALELVHRDIKPDNIMFRHHGGPPVLVDFGLVRDLNQTSLTKTWLPHGPGTPFFAPPEQLNNEKAMIDWRSDQYSLGVTLAMATFGRHPYHLDGLHDGQVVDRVAKREPLNPEFVKAVNSHGIGALSKMVAPWSVERYRTPETLRNAWEQ